MHNGSAGLISGTGSQRPLLRDDSIRRLIQAQQLPANRIIAHTAAADLPDPHYRVVVLREPDGVDLDGSRETVIAEFEDVTGP